MGDSEEALEGQASKLGKRALETKLSSVYPEGPCFSPWRGRGEGKAKKGGGRVRREEKIRVER